MMLSSGLTSLSTVNGFADLAEPDLGALLDNRNILDADRRAGRCLDERVLNLLDILVKALGLHVDLLGAGDDEAAAGVGVVIGELLLHLGNAQAVGDQLIRIEADLIFLSGAAEAGNVDDAGNILELLFSVQSSSDFCSITSTFGFLLSIVYQ